MIANVNGFWLPFNEACRRKKFTKEAMNKAISDGKVNIAEIITPKKSLIFVIIDDKYKYLTKTSSYKLDLNALIRFTNARSKKRNTRV